MEDAVYVDTHSDPDTALCLEPLVADNEQSAVVGPAEPVTHDTMPDEVVHNDEVFTLKMDGGTISAANQKQDYVYRPRSEPFHSMCLYEFVGMVEKISKRRDHQLLRHQSSSIGRELGLDPDDEVRQSEILSIMPAQPKLPRRQYMAQKQARALAALQPLTMVTSGGNTAPKPRPRQIIGPRSPDVVSDPPSSGHRSERMYMVRASDAIFGKYQVRGGIGFGTYGTVVRAQDNVTGTVVAIKVLHRDDDLNPDVRVEEHLHSIGVAHTDIKPDNIALRAHDTAKIFWLDPITGFHEKKVLVRAQICILDLGNAVELEGHGVGHGQIGAHGYRSPEVVLGLPWSYPVDRFALGCVLTELFLGRNLFSSDIDGDREYLATIDRLVGPFPDRFARSIESNHPGVFAFGDKVTVQYPSPGSLQSASEYAEAMRRLELVRPLGVHDLYLVDLLQRLLAVDPSDRISLDAAAKHRYFDSMARLQWD
ncbi:hypothetical protein ACG7TL_004473 [Trametes sanguinea]